MLALMLALAEVEIVISVVCVDEFDVGPLSFLLMIGKFFEVKSI